MNDVIGTTALDRLLDTARSTLACIWIALVSAVCVIVFLGLGVLFTAYLDLCDGFHESPNVPLGWAIAVVSLTVTAGFGLILRGRVPMLLLVGGLALQAVWFWFLITPRGSC